MADIIRKTIKGLKKRGLKGWQVGNSEEACETILGIIPSDATIGIGDSSTVRQIKIIEKLRDRGVPVINPFDPNKTNKTVEEDFNNTFWPMLEATVCDIFLTGTNALTEDGQIVNLDGAGNRVAGMVWGHPLSILVVGRNKIVKDLGEALGRIKNVIAPEHIRRKVGQGKGPPCTVNGECHDCSGEKRVCAVTTIIESKTLFTEIHVIIVDEDLGLGWDRTWPEDRINSIASHHMKFMCPLPPKGTDKSTVDELWKMARLRRTGV